MDIIRWPFWTVVALLTYLVSGHSRVFKFAIVGGSGTAIYMTLLYILTEWVGLWYMASAMMGVGIVFFWSYNLNSRWTFKLKRESK